MTNGLRCIVAFGAACSLGIASCAQDAAGQVPTQAKPPTRGSARCANGAVSRIEIVNHSLFAPEDIQGRPLSRAYGMMNRLHYRTRASHIRSEMVITEGSCFDAQQLEESMRLLRNRPYLARAVASATEQPDSSWVVRVESWDEWSTQIGADVDIENGVRFKSAALWESNFLGRGLSASMSYRPFRERNDLRLALTTERLFGTRVDGTLSLGRTRTGSFYRQGVSYPYVGERGRIRAFAWVQYDDLEHVYRTSSVHGLTHLLLPLADQRANASFERRFGGPGSLTMIGGDVSLHRRRVPGPVLQVRESDFDNPAPASDSLTSTLGRHVNPASHFRVGGRFGSRRLRFVTRSGLDLISGTQDVATGTELTVAAGRTLATWGTTSTNSYVRIDGFAGAVRGPMVGISTITFEGTRLDAPPPGERAWRDLLLRGESFAYLTSGVAIPRTMTAGVRFIARDNLAQPFQGFLGGQSGLRSHREGELPAASSVAVFAEERVDIPWFRPGLDFGLVVFADIGRGWAGDVPFGENTGWRKAVGGGVRFGFPAGTRAVNRAELAWPVGGSDEGQGVVFRIYRSHTLTGR
jgi:hypothetical protein